MFVMYFEILLIASLILFLLWYFIVRTGAGKNVGKMAEKEKEAFKRNMSDEESK